MKQLYVAWINFQRRQVSMAPHFGFELLFLPVDRKVGLARKAAQYLRNSWQTLQALREKRAEAVWVQLPQVPLMWVALLYRALFNRRASVIADCHNKMFRAPWSRFPFGVSCLKFCDIVLVHNDDVLQQALALGVPRDKVSVVEDPPATFEERGECRIFKEIPRPWLVFPAGFGDDEPLKELLQAASAVPEFSFLITGNDKNCRDQKLIAHAPGNVHFLGFLSRDDFDSLITGCDAVVALTRFDGIQLSVCGEAVGAGKPMVLADTSTLRRLFPCGSIFVRPDDATAIAWGAKQVMAANAELKEFVLREREEITSKWWETRGNLLMRQLLALGHGEARTC
jgi:glycosyltransferase involved in cell wall biosynthesis